MVSQGLRYLRLFSMLASLLIMGGCGYGFVFLQDHLAGGYKTVAIPTFENRTHEANLENLFTPALRNEFFKSKIIDVVPSEEAKVEIRGVINGVTIEPLAHSERDLEGRANKVLANEYQAKVEVSLSLVRKADQKVLWHRTVSDARQYVTSENLLRNEVRQQEAFQKIALYLMEQSHDMMLEDF